MNELKALSKNEIQSLLSSFQERHKKLVDYLDCSCKHRNLAAEWHQLNAFSYVSRMGMEMKPLGLLLCCGLVGGSKREDIGLLAAAALELFHVWSMIHDDIIDQDDTRRNGATIHRAYESLAKNYLGLNHQDAHDYGVSAGILTGDLVLTRSFEILHQYYTNSSLAPGVSTAIINFFLNEVIYGFLSGEMRDIDFRNIHIQKITSDELLTIYSQRVGQGYRFIGKAGAMIGLNSEEVHSSPFAVLEEITYHSGMAYQISNEMYKFIRQIKNGENIRELKSNITFICALNSGNDVEKQRWIELISSEDQHMASLELCNDFLRIDVEKIIQPLVNEHLAFAFQYLQAIPESNNKNTLEQWVRYISLTGRKS